MARKGVALHMRDEDLVSPHEIAVWRAFTTNPGRWMTNREAAELAREHAEVSLRTVRAHTARLHAAGLLDRTRAFPADKYTLAPKRNGDLDYRRRIEEASRVL